MIFLNDYHIDSTILNQESENYNIVDGQQRPTTLTIVINLLKKIFNPLSFNSITNNNKILKQKTE